MVNVESDIYECVDLRTGKSSRFDVSMLKSYVNAAEVDPVAAAGLDEDEYLVKSVKNHQLRSGKKYNRKGYYFLVEFVDGAEDWLPYLEVRDLEAFGVYLRGQGELCRLLKLDVPL